MKVIEDRYNTTVLDSLFIEKTCFHCRSKFAVESIDEVKMNSKTQMGGVQWDPYEETIVYYTVDCPCCGSTNEIRETFLSQKVKDLLKKKK